MATPGSVLDSLSPILAVGLSGAAPVSRLLWDGMRAVGLDVDPVGPVLLALAALAATGWRSWNTTARVCGVGVVVFLLTVLGMSTVQFVRSPMAVVFGILVTPLLAVLVGRGSVARAAISGGALALVLLAGVPETLTEMRARDPEASLVRFAATWHDWDEIRGDGAISVWPPYAYGGLHLYLTHRHDQDAPARRPVPHRALLRARRRHLPAAAGPGGARAARTGSGLPGARGGHARRVRGGRARLGLARVALPVTQGPVSPPKESPV